MKGMFNAPDLEGKTIEYFEMNEDGQVIIGFDGEIAIIEFDHSLDADFIIEEEAVRRTLLQGGKWNNYNRVHNLMNAGTLSEEEGNSWLENELKREEEQAIAQEIRQRNRRYKEFLELQKEFGTVNG